MSKNGRLIIARHAVPFHPMIEMEWVQQVEGFTQRLAQHLPSSPEQAVIVTSPRVRALALAQYTANNLAVELRQRAELGIGGRMVPTQQIRDVVTTEMQRYQLVVAISHEPICKQLAIDVWKLFGMTMRSPPSFQEYASAVIIDPSQAPDFAWEWSYI